MGAGVFKGVALFVRASETAKALMTMATATIFFIFSPLSLDVSHFTLEPLEFTTQT